MFFIFSEILSPGTFTVERSVGYRIGSIASHSSLYCVISSEQGEYYQPTLVLSLADFQNQFGASLSTPAIRMIFNQDRNARLFIVRAAKAPYVTVTIGAAGEGDYSLNINGTSVVVTAEVGDSIGVLESALIDAIQSSVIGDEVVIVNPAIVGTFRVRPSNPTDTLTVSSSYTPVGAGAGSITAVTTANPTYASVQDYTYALTAGFDPEDDLLQGFLICPEGFQNLTDPADRLVLGNAMIQLCDTDGFDWMTYIDGHGDELTVNQIQTDGIRYVSPRGHAAYFAPYLIDENDEEVPPSAACAAIAARIIRERGIQYPGAGVKYPINCKALKKRFSTREQDVLNPQNLNLVRELRNRGVVVWGFRTRSSDANYKFTNTRVILNVLIGSVRNAFDNYIGEVSDLTTLLEIEQAAASICRRMWRSGALYGESEAEAFEAICDFSNNIPDELNNGNVLLSIYAVPQNAIEKIKIEVIRVPAGQLISVVSSARDTEETTTTTPST